MSNPGRKFYRCVIATIILATVIVARGQSAEKDSSTTRIVSLVPNMTEILFSIGAGNQVVGVSDYCKFPAEAGRLPHVGGLTNPTLEPILQLRPSVVLLYRSQNDFAVRLEQLGISTRMLPVDNLADLNQAVAELGALTSRQVQASELQKKIISELGGVQASSSATTGTTITGIVVVSRDPARLSDIFQASFLSEIFELAGGKLAVPGKMALSMEDIIHANPQVIIDLSGSASTPADKSDPKPVREMGQWARLNTVDAVKNSRVYRWNDPHILLLGPSVIDAAKGFREIVTDVRTTMPRLDIPE